MKIAYFTPVSPQRTGIADYSERETLPYLSRYADIDVFIDERIKPTNQDLISNFNIHPYTEYDEMKGKYDIALYHMGNSEYHKFIYESLLKYPGITVLHDIYLHGFLWCNSLSKGDRHNYLKEFEYCHGPEGLEVAKKAVETGVYPEFEYPLIKRIVNNSLGIVCHSNFGLKKTLECNSGVFTSKINHPLRIAEEIKIIDRVDTEDLKVKLGIDKKEQVITSFGFINAHKRYPILLSAFKRFLRDYPNSILLLVGEDLMGIDGLITDLGIGKSVKMTGYAPFNRIMDYLAVSDFCVNLRYPTAGETSGSVLRIMAAGKPVIVSNVGWFSEIPDSCCLKVDVDSYEEEILLECMKLLSYDIRLRGALGANAKSYVIKEHNPEKIAREYYMFIRNILNGNEIIIEDVSEKLIELGIRDNDEDIIRKVSEQVHELF